MVHYAITLTLFPNPFLLVLVWRSNRLKQSKVQTIPEGIDHVVLSQKDSNVLCLVKLDKDEYVKRSIRIL